MLNDLKILANKRDVPYQTLAKLYLAWGIKAERRAIKTKARPSSLSERLARQRQTAKRSP